RRGEDDDSEGPHRHHRPVERNAARARPRAAARGGRRGRLPARGTRPLSRDARPRRDCLHGRPSRPSGTRGAPPRRPAARRAQPRRMGEKADSLAVEGHGPDGPVAWDHRPPAEADRARRTVRRPGRDQPGPARGADPPRDSRRRDGPLLDPRHRPRRAPVRAGRDHRQGQGRVRRPGRRCTREAELDRPPSHPFERRTVAFGLARGHAPRGRRMGVRASRRRSRTAAQGAARRRRWDRGSGDRAAGSSRCVRRNRRKQGRRANGRGEGAMMRFFRSAFVIARRDFTATVLSKTFIFFLLAPLFPLLFGGTFGSISARIASQSAKPVIAVVSSQQDFDRLSDARDELAQALGQDSAPKIIHYAPEANAAAQVKNLLASSDPPIRAVLTGGLDRPHLTGPIATDGNTTGQLRLLISNARVSAASEPSLPVTSVQASSGSLSNDRAVTAQIAQTILFVLTILLSGMLLSQLIEEKSNKIIEVIAAAVPIDAMFVGKLFAMLAASVTGLVVWISAGALLVQMIKHGGVATLPPPAIGWTGFLALTIIYFAMNYLLLGAAFLTIGAQASTAREVQTMSMPVTFG